MRPLPLAAAVCLAAAAAQADAMSDKLCPILQKTVTDTAGAIPEFAQAQLVMSVADAYDYDPDALQVVLDQADASTTAACPDARTAVLAAVQKATLTDAMR